MKLPLRALALPLLLAGALAVSTRRLPEPQAPVLGAAGCLTREQVKTAGDVTRGILKAADLFCLLSGKGASFDDPRAAASACDIVDDLPELLPVIEGLIPVRNAARARAGVVYTPRAAQDAGATQDATAR